MEPCLDALVVNKGPEMRPCSRECATEGSVGMVVVNKSFMEEVLFTGVCLAGVSVGGAREQGTGSSSSRV